jgi:phosphonate transport system substrate-binding protein
MKFSCSSLSPMVSRCYAGAALCALLLPNGALAQTSGAGKPGAYAGAARETLAVAMPRTYGKTETMGLWGGYFSHLSRCAKVDIVNLQGQSLEQSSNVDVLPEKELMESIRSGKAQLAQLNTGMVPVLVAAGMPPPFAVAGNKIGNKRSSYQLILISRVDSPYRQPRDLIGSKIAHTTLTSNSGNFAPRVLFPAIGLVPEKDYEVVFSGGHERSAIGVLHGFYPAAAVASDLYQRMVLKGEIRGSSIRTLWESPPFMSETWALGKDVSPDLQARVRKCSFNYSFSPTLRKLLPGYDTFLPVDYARDFATVTEVYQKTQLAQAAKGKL